MGSPAPPTMIPASLAISCVLALASSSPLSRSGDCAEADAYIDQVLAPADLPGDKVSFSQTIGFITFHGSARYDQGHFNGLSTIHRTGATQLCVSENIGVSSNIGLRDARAGYHVAAEFQGIEIGAPAEVKFSSLDIYFEASMPLDASSGLQLTRFEITNVGHIDVSISGLGPLDWILGKLVGAIADTVKNFIVPLIEGPIRDILQDIIDDMMPPIPEKIIAMNHF